MGLRLPGRFEERVVDRASADPAKPLEIGTLYWNEALEVIVGALVKTNEAVGETCPAGIKTGEATAEAMASMLNSLES
jgi:hypothetical protein